MIKIICGDLLESSAKYICHQVNCQGVMGSGVAKQIREKYPIVFQKYKLLCDQYAESRGELLGQIQGVRISENTAIINIFGQFHYGRGKAAYTDISALRSGCREIADHIKIGNTIAMPYRIGCGLGNGDWGEVLDMLTDVFREHYLILYKL